MYLQENTLFDLVKINRFSFFSDLSKKRVIRASIWVPLKINSIYKTTCVCFTGHLIIEHREGVRSHYSCRLCGKSFARKLHIEHHINTHMGERPFQCSFCERRFTQKVHCKTHMRCHTGERPYLCSTCGRGFSQKRHLLRHLAKHREIAFDQKDNI